MAQWIGLMVSVDCGDKGKYQGEIINATPTLITLMKAFCDGFPCPTTEVAITLVDILDLKLIEKQSPSTRSSTISIAKPIAKRASGRLYTTSESTAQNKSLQGPAQNRSKPIEIKSKTYINESKPFGSFPKYGAESKSYAGDPKGYRNDQKSIPNDLPLQMQKILGTPNKKDNVPDGRNDKTKYGRAWKNLACFGSPSEAKIDKDFDFEKNLALFDKQAVYNEINSQKPDVLKHTEQHSRPNKYRHDENVLGSNPVSFRQIIVPQTQVIEYITDEGLIIPSISTKTREKLFATAEKLGISSERCLELFGRAAAEISLQLLGGGHRLHPKNTHQTPTVVILSGANINGAMGLNVARQLTSHGVKTVVYTSPCNLDAHKSELALYRLSRNKIVTQVQDLPAIADLVIVALENHETSGKIASSDLINYANNNRAPVLALDPPPNGTQGVLTKFSLVPVLPLPHGQDNGKIYLCNLGFPIQVFEDVGIKYRSPFGPKFVIPLHLNDDS